MDKRVYEILIPVSPNSDMSFDEMLEVAACGDIWTYTKEHHAIFENKAIFISGGLSKYPAIDGIWDEGAKRFAEKIIPYRVICTPQEIDGLAELAKTHYKQIAICVFEIGTAKIY